MSEPAKIPEVGPGSGGFHLPAHILDFKPSPWAEEVWESVLEPFVRLVEENIPLILGIAGLGVCLAVGMFLLRFVSGRGTPDALQPLPGNTEQVYSVPGSQGTLF